MNERESSDQSRQIQVRPIQIGRKATPGIEEGPYYKANSPQRTRLWEPGIPGERLILSGYVRDLQGKPMAHAWLDFWQANGEGEYDNEGYTLRGHQYTDEAGRYVLETVIPGGYDVRTPHIHAKVRARENGPVLTVQLFLPGVETNKKDFLYRDDLLLEMRSTPGGKAATFDILVEG